jgi:hypothetical protein
MKQLKELELERKKITEQHQQQNQQPTGITFNIPGQPSKEVSLQEAVQILQEQQGQLEYLTQRTNELETQCKKLQIELLNKTILINKLSTPIPTPHIVLPVDDNVIHFTI